MFGNYNSIDLVVEVNDVKQFEEQLDTFTEFQSGDGYFYITSIYEIIIRIYPVKKDRFVYKDFILSASPEFLSGLPDLKERYYKSDHEIFESISFPYVIPEMREKEFFEYNKPSNSDLELSKISGLLHFHSTYSDGRNTLSEMLKAAEDKGYTYAAICDHSKSAYYANGLTEERILLQYKEIEQLQKNLDITILKGIESDILKDGMLDYTDDFLSEFQFVVASVHARFKLDEEQMTSRLLRAVENPLTDVIGHMTGRLLLSRDPYKLNIEKVLDACAANNVVVEVNANPRRLDLDWRLLYKAREKGCLFAINADAHSISEIDLIKYGVMMGKKGGLKELEVINCFDKQKFINFLNKKRKRI
jgi:DNA polymerase (family X)